MRWEWHGFWLWRVDGNHNHWREHEPDERAEDVMHALGEILEEFA